MTRRYPTANDREAAKRAGVEPAHPADSYSDPLGAQLADQADAPSKKARLKHLGGSESDAFNIALAEWTLSSSWITSREDRSHLLKVVGTALGGIAPRDEVEGMLASQLVAAFQASIECHRRAMHPEQTIEGRAMNLKHALKASTTYASLLDALNRHRGKGQQKVTVEHVHVYPGGQAIVGQVEGPGGRGDQENGDQPHAPDPPRLTHSAQPLAPMWCQDTEREPVQRAGDAERPVSSSRRQKPRRPHGQG